MLNQFQLGTIQQVLESAFGPFFEPKVALDSLGGKTRLAVIVEFEVNNYDYFADARQVNQKLVEDAAKAIAATPVFLEHARSQKLVIDDLTARNSELEAKVKELEKYQIYFELEAKMRNPVTSVGVTDVKVG
jgi:hypothetical protein